MAHCAQQFMFLVATAVLSNYLLFQLVSGIALKQPEGNSEMDTNRKQVSVEGNKFWMENGEAIELFPVHEPHLQTTFNNSRRKLGDFMSCSACTCCDSSGTTCFSVPCCFTINCSIQPYGFCKFVPVTCDCQGCGL